jgi:hypothetical protein
MYIGDAPGSATAGAYLEFFAASLRGGIGISTIFVPPVCIQACTCIRVRVRTSASAPRGRFHSSQQKTAGRVSYARKQICCVASAWLV